MAGWWVPMETLSALYSWVAGLPVFLQIPLGLAITAAAPFVLFPAWVFFKVVYIDGIIGLFREGSNLALRLLTGSGKAAEKRQGRRQ